MVEAVAKREADVEAREQRVAQREAEIKAREERLRPLEAKLLDQALAGSPLPSAPQEYSGRQADPIHDVTKLLENYRASGGELPPGLLVAEVEALQQAATRYQDQVR